MVHTACGICPAHGDTIIEISNNGKNALSAKEDVLEVLKDIDDVPEISFPIYGNKYITKYLGDYAYINIVESPEVAFLAASRPPGGAAMNMIRAVLQTVPLIVLSACMAFMAGFIVWFLVSPQKSVAIKMVKKMPPLYCMKRFISGFTVSKLSLAIRGLRNWKGQNRNPRNIKAPSTYHKSSPLQEGRKTFQNTRGSN